MDRHKTDKALVEYPLQFNQNTYQTDMFIKRAVHSFIYKIVRVLEGRLIAVASFLDVKDTPENTTSESMCKEAEEHGVEQGVVREI